MSFARRSSLREHCVALGRVALFESRIVALGCKRSSLDRATDALASVCCAPPHSAMSNPKNSAWSMPARRAGRCRRGCEPRCAAAAHARRRGTSCRSAGHIFIRSSVSAVPIDQSPRSSTRTQRCVRAAAALSKTDGTATTDANRMNRRRYTNGMDDDRITDRRAAPATLGWMTSQGTQPADLIRWLTPVCTLRTLYCHQPPPANMPWSRYISGH